MKRFTKSGLDRAEEAAQQSIRTLIGTRVSGNFRRIAERVLIAYFEDTSLRSGSRIKDTTEEIMHMEVGATMEVEATCKANIHGQFNTARKKLDNPDAKWKIEPISHMLWRVERVPDGSYVKRKDPKRNGKALFLAEIPLRRKRLFPERLPKCNHLVNGFTKDRAREILQDPNADWKGRTIASGHISVTRIK